MNDDDRVAYLAGDGGPDDDDAARADLDELRELLADESLWALPSPELEDAVVAAIAAEAAARPDGVDVDDERAGRAAAAPPPPPAVTSLEDRRRRRSRGVLAAAAAVVVVAAVGVVLVARGGGSDGTEVALEATELLPDAAGTAHVERFDSGWRVTLDATGLPRLDDGAFYQAWLRDADGVLVPIGTFNEGSDVVLWAGVSPERFSTLTVTRERADGDQASSGERVLVGTITLD